MIRQMSVRSIVPCREALLGEGSTKEGELTACFCLTWTSLCLYVPSSSCDPVESYSAPSKGEIQRRHCSWKGQGPCILQGVPGAWGSFPEMWQLGKRQVVWWLCDAVTFALGHWPGFRRLPLGSLQEISKQQKKRKSE